MSRLKRLLRWFSPHITSYIRNPIQFVSKDVRIREVEVERKWPLKNTLGTIVHETAKSLYEPFMGNLRGNHRELFKQAEC
jgi:hypothetical protein